jgi:hypothetical protein
MPEVLLPRAGLSWEMPGLFLWRSARTCHHPVATQLTFNSILERGRKVLA